MGYDFYYKLYVFLGEHAVPEYKRIILHAYRLKQKREERKGKIQGRMFFERWRLEGGEAGLCRQTKCKAIYSTKQEILDNCFFRKLAFIKNVFNVEAYVLLARFKQL